MAACTLRPDGCRAGQIHGFSLYAAGGNLIFFCKNSFHLQENDSVYRKQRYFTGSISEFSCGRKNTKAMGIFQRKVD